MANNDTFEKCKPTPLPDLLCSCETNCGYFEMCPRLRKGFHLALYSEPFKPKIRMRERTAPYSTPFQVGQHEQAWFNFTDTPSVIYYFLIYWILVMPVVLFHVVLLSISAMFDFLFVFRCESRAFFTESKHGRAALSVTSEASGESGVHPHGVGL